MTYGAQSSQHSWLTTRGALRVPKIGVTFWVIKGLSTAMGEATSDYLVHALIPEVAVLLGFAAFITALVIQLRQGRYVAWSYWLAVVMVGVFGTMAADVLHVGLQVPYAASTALYALVLVAVFWTWRRTEGTLSIHSINTPRRELFYWSAVAATFAMGTALGDLTASTLGLGYFPSAVIFAVLITVPALSFASLRRHGIGLFWVAYVLTRPLGASIADGLGKPKDASGMGFGDGAVALVLTCLIVVMVAYLATSKSDVQAGPVLEVERSRALPRASWCI